MENNNTIQISAGDYSFNFLKSGDLFNIKYKNIMIDQLAGNVIDGSVNNLYLRLHQKEGIQTLPLLGVASQSEVSFSEKQVKWAGKHDEISYTVRFYLTDLGIWFWEVNVDGNDVDGNDVEVDLIYGQDIGIADIGAVRNNEAYLSQYIDHSIYEDDQLGYVVCSRQNQGQSSGFPYLQQGSLTRSVGYSTDGFQFFGLSYKETNQPEVLSQPSLPNEVYQYEFAYVGLQSDKVKLSGQTQFVFYGLFSEDHPEVVSELEYTEDLYKAWDSVKKESTPENTAVENKIQKRPNIGEPLRTESFTIEEIKHQYPSRHQEEYEGETLLSFFTDTHEHIVLKEKELIVERPHGHILMNGNNHRSPESTFATTTYMYGVFNSQIVVGNTSFNKMITNPRNSLNVMKTSGQRIYVEIDGIYYLLTMPSVYEIGFNYTRWFYKTAQETFIITNYTTVDTPEVHLHVQTKTGKSYRYYVTNQVSLNNNEYEVPYKSEKSGEIITFKAGESSDSHNTYPDLTYRLKLEGTKFNLTNEQVLLKNTESDRYSFEVLSLEATAEWNITIQGLLHGEDIPFEERPVQTEIEHYRKYYRQVMNGFNLTNNGEKIEKLEKVNALAWWYTHNMLVHYSSPHGLEQYGGAAWGTRDVCQGPMEYFMVTQRYDSVKEIIRTVFTHQFEDDGSWPQWFMFDEYSHIQAGESHGDIIVWPLKMITDYLAVTKDFSILKEKVPYTKRGSFQLTEETATIYEHMQKEIKYIKDHFLHNTHLSSYGDGDWDDTLQPANAQLRDYMVSSWTVALTYQVFDKLSQTLKEYDQHGAAELAELSSGIKTDFNKYMLSSGVVPGFVYMEDPNEVELMLHPEDKKTGINYRLLPMQRSIISELFTKEQAESHYDIIKEHLDCPDGVRLMNRPANYTGGVSTHFQRAETASNFGREVGLHYVHAHIRFIEAMAKLGKEDEVWTGLSKINPINIQDIVPNAERRQSNAYFSSSDGKFSTRYEAQDNFGKLRDGSVTVKGGWRIYSSGPGIYMNQLISNWLGVRPENGGLVIDPVISNDFNGLHFNFKINEKPVTFVYHLNEGNNQVMINGKKVEGKMLENRYRDSGMFIDAEQLELINNEHENTVEIYM